MRWITWRLFLLLAGCMGTAQATVNHARVQSIAQEVRGQVGLPALVIAVAKPDGTIHLAADGNRRTGDRDAVEPGDLVHIGSAIKP